MFVEFFIRPRPFHPAIGEERIFEKELDHFPDKKTFFPAQIGIFRIQPARTEQRRNPAVSYENRVLDDQLAVIVFILRQGFIVARRHGLMNQGLGDPREMPAILRKPDIEIRILAPPEIFIEPVEGLIRRKPSHL